MTGSTPIERLDHVLEAADTAFLPSMYVKGSVSALAETETFDEALHFTCEGVRCAEAEGFEIEFVSDDDADADDVEWSDVLDVASEDAELGLRGDFDTAAVQVDVGALLDLTADGDLLADGLSITQVPDMRVWGLWGEHGAAMVLIVDGALSGTFLEIPITGEMSLATVLVGGQASGTNPSGSGRATWSGIAEAVSTETLTRREGTATLTIDDLALPRVDVEIAISGWSIGSPRWESIPVSDGGFRAGSREIDFLQGAFFGPSHEEAWGAFDTGAHIGSFGTKRQP